MPPKAAAAGGSALGARLGAARAAAGLAIEKLREGPSANWEKVGRAAVLLRRRTAHGRRAPAREAPRRPSAAALACMSVAPHLNS